MKAKRLDQKQQASLATRKRKMNDLQKLKSAATWDYFDVAI